MLPCDLVYVGEISKPHGIRGELSLHFVAESPSILLGAVFLTPPCALPLDVSKKKIDSNCKQISHVHELSSSISDFGTIKSAENLPSELFRSVEIIKFRVHHGSVLITIEHVTDRTEAEKYRRCKVYIPRKKLPQLSDDECYIADMLNLSVMIASDTQKEILGTLVAIDTPAGQELWTIRTNDGIEILFPAVPEFVHTIDLDEGIITISPPPGLLELYTN